MLYLPAILKGAERIVSNTGICDIAWFYFSEFAEWHDDYIMIIMVITVNLLFCYYFSK